MVADTQRSPACAFRGAIDRHFAGKVRPAEETALRAHLPGCSLCRARYERQLLLARLAHAPLPDIDRLAIGLGLPAENAGGGLRVAGGRWVAAGVIVAGCLGVLLARDGAPVRPGGGDHAAAAPARDPSELIVIEDAERRQCRVVTVAEAALLMSRD
jgi:hypothetical protein